MPIIHGRGRSCPALALSDTGLAVFHHFKPFWLADVLYRGAVRRQGESVAKRSHPHDGWFCVCGGSLTVAEGMRCARREGAGGAKR